MTSAYMFFVKDQHKQVSSQNPGLKMTDVGRILGEKWRGMSQEQKQQYQKQADNLPKVVREKKEAKKEKRPLNGYMKFAQQKRATVAAQNPGLKVTEVSKKLGAIWHSLSDSEKLSYK